MGAYKVNLWKWFFSTALTMVWMSVTFAKFLTPIMTDQVFYPGGDHGENCRQFLEGVIGSPGLIVVLGIVAVAFLTFLTSETIAFIRHLLNPIGYITSKVKFSAEIGGGETEETWRNESTTYENPAAQTVSFNEGVATFDQPDNTEDTANRTMVDEETGEIVLTDSEPESSGNISGKPEPETGKDVELVVETGAREEKARGKSLTHYDLSTPINPREPFTAYKFPTLNLLKKYDNDSKPYIDKEELIANKKRIVEVLNSFGVQIREIKATVSTYNHALRDYSGGGCPHLKDTQS